MTARDTAPDTLPANGRPLRVAHVTTVDLSLRYLLADQLRRIAREGYEVTGVSAFGPDVAYLEARGIRHLAAPMTRRFTPAADLRALLALVRLMRAERFDLVHTHTPKAGLLGQLAARIAGVPHVVNTLHGFYFHDDTPPMKRRFYVWMERIAARCSDAILSQSAEDIETAVAEGIAPRERLALLGNGIDLTRFDRGSLDPAAQAALRASLGIADDALVIGFVGRLVEEKGVLDLLRAVPALVERFPSLRVLLIGPRDDDKADALGPEVAADPALERACVFTGLRHDLPALYGLMDVFVLPSHREGFPRVPMEACAMGVPVVLTDIRGCREVVRAGEAVGVDGARARVRAGDNGLLVPAGDPEALGEAIAALLADAARRGELGAAGRRIARERFDQERVFERVLATYERLFASPRRRGPVARGFTARSATRR